MQIKCVNMIKLQRAYLLSFLYCCPDFILSKNVSKYDTYFIYILEFLAHIKFYKVVLNIFQVKME